MEARVSPLVVDGLLSTIRPVPPFTDPVIRSLIISYMKWMPLAVPSRWETCPDSFCIVRMAWLQDSKIVVPKHAEVFCQSRKERADRLYVVQIEMPDVQLGVPYHYPGYVRSGEELREVRGSSCVHLNRTTIYQEGKVVVCEPHLDTNDLTDCGAGISYYRANREAPAAHWIPVHKQSTCRLEEVQHILRAEREDGAVVMVNQEEKKGEAHVMVVVVPPQPESKSRQVSVLMGSQPVAQQPEMMAQAELQYLPLSVHVLEELAQLPPPPSRHMPVPSAPELADIVPISEVDARPSKVVVLQ